MRICEVLGNVTLSRADPAIVGGRLLLVRPLTQENLRSGRGERLEELVVYDELGAGLGSRIGASEGREAAMPFHPERKPIDAYNACILDCVELVPLKTRKGWICGALTAALAAVALVWAGSLSYAQSSQAQPRRPERIRTYDVQHIRTELTIDPEAGAIQGKVTHTLRPLYPHFRSAVFDCGELEVSRVRLGASGANCTFQLKDSKLEIALDRDYEPRDELSLTIDYAGRPKRGMYFVYPDPGDPKKPVCVYTQGEPEDTRYWLPCYDYPNDRATSETVVTVPRRLTVVSNGKLVEARDDTSAGTKTFHWRMETAHVSYLISIVAGELKRFDDRAGELPLEYYVPAPDGDEATVRRAFGRTPKMIEFFGERIGIPYPYSKYAQVVVPDFFGGGMENITAATLNRRALRDERAALEGDADGLLAHELAHQWFGDLITCRDWANIWLNEGFASYFDLLFTEHDRGRDEFRADLRRTMTAAAGADKPDNHRPVVHDRFNHANQIFGSHAYPKGAAVLHMLRGQLGEEAFWKAIRHYAKTYREQVVDTRDFQKAVEEASSQKLDWFFDQWLYKPGCPELEVRWGWEESDRTARVSVKQVQKREGGVPVFRLPAKIEFTDDAGTQAVSVVIDQAEQQFVFPLKQKPQMVLFDKENWLIRKLNFQKTPAEWLYQLQRADDMIARVEAAEALAKLPVSDAHVKALVDRLKAEKCHAGRSAMVTALGALKGAIAEEAVCKALGDADARVRRSAAAALDGFSGAKVEEDLRRVWKEEPAYGPRLAALRSLARRKPKDVWSLLEEALRTASQDDQIAVAALGLVVEHRHPRRREIVLGATAFGNGPTLRREATGKLVQLGKEEPEIVSHLTRLLDDPSPPIRSAAGTALRELGEKSAVAALEARAAKEPRDSVKRELTSAVEALKKQAAAGDETQKKADGLETEAKKHEAKAKLLRNQAQRLRLEVEARALEKEAAGVK